MDISNTKNNINAFIAVFPLIFAALMIWIRINHYPTYEIIGREDHIIEYAQFFFFLGGGILALLIALKFRAICKLMFVAFLIASFLLIVVAGEEISWGERIFNIDAHEIFDGDTEIPLLEDNVQGEMNLHNFRPIHNIVGTLYIIAGSYLIFAWYGRQILIKLFQISNEVKQYLSFLTPHPILTLYFVPVYINLFNRRQIGIAPQDYEMVEFLLSLGILIFLIYCYAKLCKGFKSAR